MFSGVAADGHEPLMQHCSSARSSTETECSSQAHIDISILLIRVAGPFAVLIVILSTLTLSLRVLVRLLLIFTLWVCSRRSGRLRQVSVRQTVSAPQAHICSVHLLWGGKADKSGRAEAHCEAGAKPALHSQVLAHTDSGEQKQANRQC